MQWYNGPTETLLKDWGYSDNPLWADYQVLGTTAAAVSVLMGVEDVLPVMIGSRGCAAHVRFTIVAWGYDFGLGPRAFPFIEITQQNVIHGDYHASDEQMNALKKAVSRHGYKLIALVASDETLLSCADLEPLRSQIESETGVKTGVCDVSPSSGPNQWKGYDTALNLLFSSVWDDPVEKNDGINLVGWKWPSRERKHDIGACLNLLNELGLKVNCVLPGGSKLNDYRTALGARANQVWCMSYLGDTVERMKSEKGIPYGGTTPPYGMVGTMEWLSELGDALGNRDELLENAEKVRERYLPELAELQEKLRGKRCFVSGGPGRLPGLLNVMGDLQTNVCAAALFWHHPSVQPNLPRIMKRLTKMPEKFLVSPSLYEIDEIARDYHPDFWMGGFQEMHACKKYGIPFIPITVYTSSHQCFEGVINVGKKILKALDGFDFVANPFQAVEE